MNGTEEFPPGDPDIYDYWEYRLVEFDGGVRLIEVYYLDVEHSEIVGWGEVSVDGDTPAELGYALMEMMQACTHAVWSPKGVLQASDLPETEPGAIFELCEIDNN